MCDSYWKKQQDKSVEQDGLNGEDVEWRESQGPKCRSQAAEGEGSL